MSGFMVSVLSVCRLGLSLPMTLVYAPVYI
nr:MAG TPA: hypothetical protein [Caudoviricetes sp.]